MRAKHDRRGLALIEVLVILAVVVILAAVLVARLDRSRELARRSSCADNLRRLGAALASYQDVCGCYPMSQARGEGHGNGASQFTFALPFLEQAAVYNAYNFDWENYHASNATAVSARIATFLCPDNPRTGLVTASEARLPGASKFARAHYGANWGGGHPWEYGRAFVRQNGIYKGVMMAVQLPDGQRDGPDGKPLGRCISRSEITDGAGFTIALAEKRDSFGWGVGGFGGSEFDVGGEMVYPDADDPIDLRVLTGSEHPEGVNALFCDGAVRLLPPTIHRSLWFALVTRAGGETIDSDQLPADR